MSGPRERAQWVALHRRYGAASRQQDPAWASASDTSQPPMTPRNAVAEWFGRSTSDLLPARLSSAIAPQAEDVCEAFCPV
uniref:Uncharacterized protein n=1 Tax=Mycena chlorophos TaxID=658473 RepID=A0ABQ0L4G6_MYCCL|nr:predicted protein [Mycena chlorophos]